MTIQETLPTNQAIRWFKQQSLELMGEQLSAGNYPVYPPFEDRFFCDDPSVDAAAAIREPGPWWTEDIDAVEGQDLQLHPWFEDMVRDRSIGALAGRGFYWEFGGNRTADPIVIRHDFDEPHILVVTRKDTGNVALPGGFIDAGEEEFEAAIREGLEETTIDVLDFEYTARKVYDGVLSDPRTTAHAWPETTAFRIDLTNPDQTAKLPIGPVPSPDEGTENYLWLPASTNHALFGSHRLLCQLALRKQVTL